MLVPVPQPERADTTPAGRAASATVPRERCASVCTQPSPVVDAQVVPDEEVSRSAKALLADGAAATLANDDDPRDTPAEAVVRLADAVVPLC